MNNYMAVGRIVRDPELVETDSGKKYCNITLAIPRSYKNAEGIYETDFIDCKLWSSIAETTAEYCKKGDTVGVKGRIETSTYEVDGENKKSFQIVADKVSFLSSAKVHEKEESTEEIEKSDDDLEI